METDLISVIIPVYNVQKYLDKCVKSIVNQTYKNLEIILVDDGSTDSSGQLCDTWATIDSRIVVIHKPNGGLSDARNVGIEISHGKFYSFVDSDDFLENSSIEVMYTTMIENNCQIAVCNMLRVYKNGDINIFYKPSDEIKILKGQERFETLKQPSVCNKLFLSSLFNDVKFPKGKYYEDTFVYHVLAYNSEKIALTGYDGYYYFYRDNSILGQFNFTDRYFDMAEAIYNRMIFLMEHNINLYAEESCLSLYVIAANCEKYITKTKNNEKNFLQLHIWFDKAFHYLINCPTINLKQKIRLLILRYLPFIHNKLY